MELSMYELMRYTFLVLLGLAGMVVLFLSLAVTGTYVAFNGDYPTTPDLNAAIWMMGLSALCACLLLSRDFARYNPSLTLGWLGKNKEELTGYAVITFIVMIFVAL